MTARGCARRLEPAAAVALRHRGLRRRSPSPRSLAHADVFLVAEDPAASTPRSGALRGPSRRGRARRRPRRLPPRQLARPRVRLSRARCASPGVVVLHEWSLHHLVLHETVERGDVSVLPARDAARPRRARGRSWPARWPARWAATCCPRSFPLNDRVLERSLGRGRPDRGRGRAGRAAAARRARAFICRHHLALPLDPLPSRAEARRALGLPGGRAPGRPRPAWPPPPRGSTPRCARWPGCGASIPRCTSSWRATAIPGCRSRSGRDDAGLAGALDAHRAPGPARLRAPSLRRRRGARPALPVPRRDVGRPRARARRRAARCWSPRARPPPTSSPRASWCRSTPGPHEEDGARRAARPPPRVARPARDASARLARAHVREHHDLERGDARAGALPRGRPPPEGVAGRRGGGGGALRTAACSAYFTEEVRAGARDLGLLGRAPRPRRAPARRWRGAAQPAERRPPDLSVVIPAYNEEAPAAADPRAAARVPRPGIAGPRDRRGRRRLARLRRRSSRARRARRWCATTATAARAFAARRGMLLARGAAAPDDRRRPLDAHRGPRRG